MTDWNPFSRRESHSVLVIRTHKVWTILSWILSLVVSVYYTVRAPEDGHGRVILHRSIWAQNYAHPGAFTMNHVIAEIYWIILFILQIGFVAHLFSRSAETVSAAANVSSHFTLHNVLHSIFVLLFVRSHFFWAEVVLLVNLVNLSALYFRHNTAPRFIHAPVASGPLAWTFVAVYWNGAFLVRDPLGFVARIFGNVFIWSILTYGVFFLVAYNDYTMGFALSVLAAAIGVAQFQRQVIALQWIFAFIIMALLFVLTLVVAILTWGGRQAPWRRRRVGEVDERAPLLNE